MNHTTQFNHAPWRVYLRASNMLKFREHRGVGDLRGRSEAGTCRDSWCCSTRGTDRPGAKPPGAQAFLPGVYQASRIPRIREADPVSPAIRGMYTRRRGGNRSCAQGHRRSGGKAIGDQAVTHRAVQLAVSMRMSVPGGHDISKGKAGGNRECRCRLGRRRLPIIACFPCADWWSGVCDLCASYKLGLGHARHRQEQ